MNIKSWIIEKWEWVKSKWKQFLAVIATGVLLAQVIPTPIPQHLKLKASSERVLNSRVVLQEKCVKWETNGTSTQVCKQTAYENIIKYLYASDIEVPKEEGEDISKRTKNAKFFKGKLKDEGQEWTGRFYAGEPFYEENDIWYQTETATTTPDAFNQQMSSILGEIAFAITTTTYSGAGDGVVEYIGSGAEVWDDVHDASSGTAADYTTNLFLANRYPGITWGSPHWDMTRAFVPFDTSVLPDNANISSTTLNMYYTYANIANDTAYDYIVVVQTTQASSTILGTADFNQCGSVDNPTEGSNQLSLASIATGQYSVLTFNATGRGWVSKTDYTKIGIREGDDATDNEPGTPNTGYNGWSARTSEYADITSDPYLTIVYTIPAPSEATPEFQWF